MCSSTYHMSYLKECSAVLSTDEITAVRKNLQAKKTSVTDEFVGLDEKRPKDSV